MATDAQIEANRLNAQRSTGPKTVEGKERASRNGVRHEILARVVPAETAGYQELLRGLYEALRPMDESQRFLVDQIAVAIIRLQRSIGAETHYIKCMSRTDADSPSKSAIDDYLRTKSAPLAMRYEAAHNRQIQRNLRLLRDMKSEWQWKAARAGDCPYLESDPTEETAVTPGEEAAIRQEDPTRDCGIAVEAQDTSEHVTAPPVTESPLAELGSFRKNNTNAASQRREPGRRRRVRPAYSASTPRASPV